MTMCDFPLYGESVYSFQDEKKVRKVKKTRKKNKKQLDMTPVAK